MMRRAHRSNACELSVSEPEADVWAVLTLNPPTRRGRVLLLSQMKCDILSFHVGNPIEI
jgi:hypothetical protein